jgi:hypothetical protein
LAKFVIYEEDAVVTIFIIGTHEDQNLGKNLSIIVEKYLKNRNIDHCPEGIVAIALVRIPPS